MAKGQRIVILTGAGLSAESGLATFRDAGGIWAKYDYREVATPQGFVRNPALVHEFYNMRGRDLLSCAPNAAHAALARLEREHAVRNGGEVLIVTQNIDNLGRQLAPAALLSAAALLALIATTQWLGRRPAPEPTRTAEPAPPSPGAAPVVSGEAASAALAVAAWVRTRDGVGERVESGGLVRVGDELSLDVRSAEPLHLYVLNEDDAGAVFTLFPVAGSDLSNPVPAGRTLALPGARSGEAMHWQVSSPAQRERFLVIASCTPLAALEARLAAMPGSS